MAGLPEFELPDKVLDYARSHPTNGLAAAFDPIFNQLITDAANSLRSTFPELNSTEHADMLVQDLVDIKRYKLPGGSLRLLVAMEIAHDAIFKKSL